MSVTNAGTVPTGITDPARHDVLVPQWLVLAGLSGQAVKLYAYLASVPGSDDGEAVKQTRLAAVLGLSHPSKVKRYTDELVAAGAVEVSQVTFGGGFRRRNVYTVRRTPPPGYRGPLTVADLVPQEEHIAA